MLQLELVRKKNAVAVLAGSAMLALSANAHALLGDILPPILPVSTILTFDFDGQFTMYDRNGEVVPNETPGVMGTITLDAVSFGGTASMTGEFFNVPFFADGDLSAYVGLLAGDKCAGAFMCAHSEIDFSYNGIIVPVQAAFGLNPVIPGLTDLLSLNLGAEFAVASIDTDGNGIPGTEITAFPFAGFSPFFSGTATLVGINLLGSPIPNPDICIPITPVPEPAEWAMMLVGLGLVGAAARRRQALVAA